MDDNPRSPSGATPFTRKVSPRWGSGTFCDGSNNPRLTPRATQFRPSGAEECDRNREVASLPTAHSSDTLMTSELPHRICYLISHFHPRESGAERQCLAQGRELVRRGHSARVVTRFIPGLPEDDEIDGVRIHRWIHTSEIGPLFGVSYVRGVIRALRKLRPQYDLIHTHQALWESIATGLGRDFFRGAPVLVQPASSGYYGEAEEMARTKGFWFLRKCSLRNPMFAAISADIERQWLEMGVPADRMTRMASGVDADHFRPGPSAVEAMLPSRPRVVFTGRLHPQKNLDLLLKAWSSVATNRPGTLMLVGDGPDRIALEEQAAQLGIGDRVHFAGSVADPAEHLRAADVFVLPSVAEGMSNSLLEAMATGLPSLVSDIGGNRDLITENVTGRLIASDDRNAWVSALISLIEHPESSRNLGAEARRVIERQYAMPVVVDRYLALYRRMLSTRA
jgi:glycosyltransferase involved in cell wall biosynthesis